ncbi:uncharacterized protein J3D65DRAFT_631056 [Phyllosticta citribraziliensis]|uniref:Glycoside hydrolase subgroup catalytic core protein n=1 Tax=Phyllosticta citribraziliensis TaxID=989973 RepID=A0ABR1LJJ6_9PEZI
MNLYVETDTTASFIVDARLSLVTGEPYYNGVYHKDTKETTPFDHLYIDISLSDSGRSLVADKNVSVNSTANEFQFSLAGIKAQLEPYNVTLVGASRDGNQSYTATTQLFKLPARTDGGSVVKLDRLYNGLQVQDYLSNSDAWSSLFPYSFYGSWDGYFQRAIVDNAKAYKEYGYNIVHVVPNAGLANEAFNFTEFDLFMDTCDELGLWVMYDMRWTYKNLSSVTEQVNRYKARKSLLLWYTADEPDGQSDTLNATVDTYTHIKSLDAYHPISLCLNCLNFHYDAYSSGADIILSDVYPIAVNTSYSDVYGTPCNTTYGCCGCDDCTGAFEDVSTRLDLFATYQTWLRQEPKAFWGVPQAFGNETFWSRYPTDAEEAVMALLSVNHGATGIVAWDWPTQPDIVTVTAGLAKALTAADVADLLLAARAAPLVVTGRERVDAAAWRVGGKMLVSVVSLEYEDTPESVSIALPVAASGSSTKWGPGGWTVSGSTLSKQGLQALEVDVLVLDVVAGA